MEYCLLSPYRIPPRLAAYKVPNLGDGFILRAVERVLAPRRASGCYSTRVPPGLAARAAMQRSGTVVIAGANQLDDRYTIWPGLDAGTLRRSRWRFVPFALGCNGDPERNRAMSAPTRELLEAVHERVEFSAWRCPATLRYLRQALPQLGDRFLMTGCPVLLDEPLLNAGRFHDGEAHVAVTVTERGDFWDRESRLLRAVALRFPRARLSLVIHQDFRRPGGLRRLLSSAGTPAADAERVQALRGYAARLGYAIVVPASADEALGFYADVDLHVGSRLHAHLLLLSRNRRSWLVPVDGRGRGMAEAFDYPLVDAWRIESSLDRLWDHDFEPLRVQARTAWAQMRRFVDSWTR